MLYYANLVFCHLTVRQLSNCTNQCVKTENVEKISTSLICLKLNQNTIVVFVRRFSQVLKYSELISTIFMRGKFILQHVMGVKRDLYRSLDSMLILKRGLNVMYSAKFVIRGIMMLLVISANTTKENMLRRQQFVAHFVQRGSQQIATEK